MRNMKSEEKGNLVTENKLISPDSSVNPFLS